MRFIVDGTNYCHTLWAGTNGRCDVPRSLLSLVQCFRERYSSPRVDVVFDPGGPTWRHALYADYKGGRDAKPAELVRVLEAARDLCDREDLLGPSVPGFEADDVIATLATQALARRERVVIYSRDKDLRQLLLPGLVSLMTRAIRVQGAWDFTFLTAARLYDEAGLEPAQWADFRALAGDTSDNWPGAAKIGEKIATAIVQEAGSLEAAMGNLWALKLSERQRDALLAFDWRLGLQLMTLQRQVALYEPA